MKILRIAKEVQMQNNRRARFCLRAFAVGSLLLSMSSLARSQDVSDKSPREPAPDLKSLAAAVRELQSQVQSLNSQVSELRTSEQRALLEAADLRAQVNRTKDQSAAKIAGGDVSLRPPPPQASAIDLPASPEMPAGNSLEQRVSSLEDDQHLMNDKIAEQSQTKVESGSKYRVRLSGIILLNTSVTRGSVDNLDFPQIATPPTAPGDSGAFSGSLR